MAKRSEAMSEGPRPHKGVASYLRFYVLATLIFLIVVMVISGLPQAEVPEEVLNALNGTSASSAIIGAWVTDAIVTPRIWELWGAGITTAVLAYIVYKGLGRISAALESTGKKGLGKLPAATMVMHAAGAAILLGGSAYLSTTTGDIVSEAVASIGNESVAGTEAVQTAVVSALISVIKSPQMMFVSLGEAAAAVLVLGSLIIAYWVLGKEVSVRLSNVVLFALSLELMARLADRLYTAAAPLPPPIAPQTLSFAVFAAFLFRVIVQYSHTYRLDEWFAGLGAGSRGEGVSGGSAEE